MFLKMLKECKIAFKNKNARINNIQWYENTVIK